MGLLPWVRREWLDAVPRIVDEALRRWDLRSTEELGGLASRVLACTDRSGRELVLKVAPPEASPTLEAAALRQWHGRGAPRLVALADDLGALLIERIRPGTPLPPADDDGAVPSVAATLRRLRAAPLRGSHPFPDQSAFIDVWLARMRASAEDGTAGIGPLDAARDAALALEESCTAAVLLHGDLIDKNLLLGPDGYVAVDPIPRVGDPCSDVGFFAAYHPPARRIAARAKELAVAVGLDPGRAARWAAVWAVGEATETWRRDSTELQAWMASPEASALLQQR